MPRLAARNPVGPCPVPSGPADGGAVRQGAPMTTPEPKDPQPRDIALELETPELAAELEAQSDPETSASADES
jgi:hypothetical protein